MLKQLKALWAKFCLHRWDLVPDADLGDVRTCARCGRRDVLTVDGWEEVGQ